MAYSKCEEGHTVSVRTFSKCQKRQMPKIAVQPKNGTAVKTATFYLI